MIVSKMANTHVTPNEQIKLINKWEWQFFLIYAIPVFACGSLYG